MLLNHLPLLLLFGFAIAGCGYKSTVERVVVSGSVAYQDQPVEIGAIRFIPEAGSKLPTSGAVILHGKFLADVHGGVPVGTHRVWIEAYESQAQATSPKEGAPTLGSAAGVGRQYLPEKYNSRSETMVTIEKGMNLVRQDFQLTD